MKVEIKMQKIARDYNYNQHNSHRAEPVDEYSPHCKNNPEDFNQELNYALHPVD